MIDPKSVFLEQGIGQDDEFTHDGGEGEFGFFAGFDQALVEGAEFGIVAAGGERGPVEGAARAGAATLDVALAYGLGAVVGERGDTGEAGDGAAVEGAELGEVDEQVGGDAGADARDRDEDLIAARQGWIGGDPGGDLGGQALDMAVEAFEPPSDLAPEEGGLACREAVGERRALGGCGIARNGLTTATAKPLWLSERWARR